MGDFYEVCDTELSYGSVGSRDFAESLKSITDITLSLLCTSLWLKAMNVINRDKYLNELAHRGNFGGESRDIDFLLHLRFFFLQHDTLCFIILNELVKNKLVTIVTD